MSPGYRLKDLSLKELKKKKAWLEKIEEDYEQQKRDADTENRAENNEERRDG